MSRNQILLIVFGGVLILFGIPLTLYLVSQQQDPRSRASEVIYPDDINFAQQQPTPPASVQQTCEAPTSPTSTDISYPYASGEIVDLDQAGCTWDSVEGAVSFKVRVTDINTSTVVRDDTVPSSTTAAVFPVVQGNTYLCEVSAVSSCGAVSAVSSDQQICETQGFVSPTPSLTPVPSAPQPTATPLPTTPDVPTPTTPVKPPPPPTGTVETLVIGGGIAAAVIAFGAALLIL